MGKEASLADAILVCHPIFLSNEDLVSSFDCVTSQKSVREGGYGKDFLPVQLMHPLEMKLRMNSEPGNLNLVAAV